MEKKLLANAKLTSKCQLTVPKLVREKLNLEEGDVVIFYEDNNQNVKILNKNNCEVVPKDDKKVSGIERGSKNVKKRSSNWYAKKGDNIE